MGHGTCHMSQVICTLLSSLVTHPCYAPLSYPPLSFLHGPDDDGSRFEKKKREPRAPREPRADGEVREKKKRVRKPKPVKKLDEVCNNYLAGKCRNGDECRRSHSPEGIEQKIEKLDEICNNFLEGKCKYGDLCRRIHE